MKLWTWQNPDFDITDPSQKVDSLNNSQYLLVDEYSDLEAIERHKQAYQYLWDKYQTDQILWCYSSFETATSNGARHYKGMDLWELDIPNSFVLDTICEVAWHWILTDSNCAYPDCFKDYFLSLKSNLIKRGVAYNSDAFYNDFNSYWGNLNSKELYNILSVDLNMCKIGCPTIIIRHPVNEQWVASKTPHNKVPFRRRNS